MECNKCNALPPPEKDVIANKRCSIVYEIRTLCQCSYFWVKFDSQIEQRPSCTISLNETSWKSRENITKSWFPF